MLFIDEIHRLNRAVEEVLYPAMEDFQLDIMLGKGPSARTLRLDLPKFTLVGATTRTGLLAAPLRDRFGIIHRLEFYTPDDLADRPASARMLGVEIDDGGAEAGLAPPDAAYRQPPAAPRSRLRPGARRRHHRRAVAQEAMELLEIDDAGPGRSSTGRSCDLLAETFEGRPVGLGTLADSVGESADTIEDVYEPFLLQEGLLKRTPRGRVATPRAYRHLGLDPPPETGQAGLF